MSSGSITRVISTLLISHPRGTSGDKLTENGIWWKGPEFLWSPNSQWQRADVLPLSEITKAEVGKNREAITHILMNTTDGKVDQMRLDEITECTRYSNLNGLFLSLRW